MVILLIIIVQELVFRQNILVSKKFLIITSLTSLFLTMKIESITTRYVTKFNNKPDRTDQNLGTSKIASKTLRQKRMEISKEIKPRTSG